MKLIVSVVFALIAFAGNSVLCRLALLANPTAQIDAASFTSVRLISAAITLLILIQFTQSEKPSNKAFWREVLAGYTSKKGLGLWYLFIYAACFSFAYISLDTGIGALLLFSTVQITMISISLFRGARLSILEWLGLLLAAAGFVALVWPDLTSPQWQPSLLMIIAGLGWAMYTLAGKGSVNPLRETGLHFIRTVPLCIALSVFFLAGRSMTLEGALLAITSGAITSGCGYAIWYSALRHLNTTQAAVLQLLVPVLAAVAGVIFAGELLDLHFYITSSMILGGVAIVIITGAKLRART
ncbi:DMT family transporter [Sessilibacter sp. MAH1]